MRSTLLIIIYCLYALSAVDANPVSKIGSAEVQQDNAKASRPLNFWSDDKSDDVDKDEKWGKHGKDDKDNKWSKYDDDDYYGGKGQDDCASRSVAVLIGTTTYAIPCLQGGSIVNLNGLIPTPEASSPAVSSSAFYIVKSSSSVDSSSSASSATSAEASSATDSTTTTTDSTPATTDTTTTTTDNTTTTTDSTTTTTDSTTTTTDTTTSADSVPSTFAVTLYAVTNCRDAETTSLNSGCFDYHISPILLFSVGTTSTTNIKIDFYTEPSCAGSPVIETQISSDACSQNLFTEGFIESYSVTTI